MRIARFVSMALLAGTVLASPAAAADAAAASADQASQPEKQICKREQRVGTRLSQRICMTKAQWRQREITFDEHNRRLKDNADRAVQERILPGEKTNNGG